jgi:secreted PhoX family phosphatase
MRRRQPRHHNLDEYSTMLKHPAKIDPEDLPSNTSRNEHFQTIVERAQGRRRFLKTGVGLSAAMFLAGPLAACSSGRAGRASAQTGPLLGFDGIAASTSDSVRIAQGYTATPFAPWGTPLFAGDPAWMSDASQDAQAQARQVGDNHDGIHYFPLDGSSEEGLLVMNHEYTTVSDKGYTWLFGPDGTEPWTAAKMNKAIQQLWQRMDALEYLSRLRRKFQQLLWHNVRQGHAQRSPETLWPDRRAHGVPLGGICRTL